MNQAKDIVESTTKKTKDSRRKTSVTYDKIKEVLLSDINKEKNEHKHNFKIVVKI